MRVLTIINSANIGGVEKTLLTCLNNMTNENMDMTILCFQKNGSLEPEFKKLGVKFLYIKKTGLIFLDFVQLLIILLKHKFDIVHSRFGFTSGGFVLAAKLAKTKIFVSLHSTHPSSIEIFKKNPFVYKVLSVQLRVHKFLIKNLSTKIIGHSRSNLDLNFPNWEKDSRFKLLYNGVDFNLLDQSVEKNPRLDSFIDKEDFTILHIGSFREPKNHLFLIEVFKLLKTVDNKFKLILVGQGGLFNTVVERVKTLELNDSVFFAGYDKNINKYLDKASLFVLPSINEGLANVLIEAQYKKVPICASDLPPLYESGYKDYHKYYFNPYNKEDALNKLVKIVDDIKTGRLEETKEKAKRYVVDNFSIQSMVKGIMNIYDDKQ